MVVVGFGAAGTSTGVCLTGTVGMGPVGADGSFAGIFGSVIGCVVFYFCGAGAGVVCFGG